VREVSIVRVFSNGIIITMHDPDPIEAHLASYAPEIGAICRALRATARRIMPQAHEMWYHASIGYSVSTSPFDRVCYIAPMNGYVNLGVFYGTHLEDPRHLLEGTGRRMRHVKVRSLDQASDPAIAALLQAAWLDGPASVAAVKARRASKRQASHEASDVST